MDVIFHTLHGRLAGVWLGGVVFTMFVVSPAFKAIRWSEIERVRARSVVGRYCARVANANLGLLLLFAAVYGVVRGFGVLLLAEYVLLAVLLGLVGAHGTYFGRKIAEFAAAGGEELRRAAEGLGEAIPPSLPDEPLGERGDLGSRRERLGKEEHANR